MFVHVPQAHHVEHPIPFRAHFFAYGMEGCLLFGRLEGNGLAISGFPEKVLNDAFRQENVEAILKNRVNRVIVDAAQ